MTDPNSAVKNKQTTILVVSAVVIMILVIFGMFFFDSAPKASSQKPPEVAITPPGSVDDKDAWRTQQAAQEANNTSEINSLKQMLQDQQAKQEKLQDEVSKQKNVQEQGGSKLDNALLSQPLPSGSRGHELDPPYPTKTGMQPGQAVPLNAPLSQPLPEAPKRELEVIQFSNPNPQGALIKSYEQSKPEVLGFPVNEEAKKVSYTNPGDAKNIVEFMPADSFVRVAMLNGVDAPTGGQVESDPLPVALQVLDTANLANKYKLNIKDCRFLAGAWGDLNSQRTMARLVNLTCIIDGQTVEIPVKGVLMGEDGKVGIRGRLVTKQGQLIANSLLSGFAGSVGQAFSQSATTTSISPLGATTTVTPGQAWRAGVGGGLSSTGNALQQYFLKAADKMFPVIETDSGRVIEVLITKGAQYTLGPKDNGNTYRDMLTRNGIPTRSENDDD